MADCVLKVGAGPEIAVVSTKAFTSQLATLYLLAQAVIKRYSQGQEKIKKLGRTLVKWLNKKLEYQPLLFYRIKQEMEILDNCIDEYYRGHVTQIHTTLSEDGKKVFSSGKMIHLK